jgi:hypothetical protein
MGRPRESWLFRYICNPRKHRETGFWRRGWDSNPRYAQTYNGFRDRPDRPLRHLSSARGGAPYRRHPTRSQPSSPRRFERRGAQVQPGHAEDGSNSIPPRAAALPRLSSRRAGGAPVCRCANLGSAGANSARSWRRARRPAHVRSQDRGSLQHTAKFRHGGSCGPSSPCDVASPRFGSGRRICASLR